MRQQNIQLENAIHSTRTISAAITSNQSLRKGPNNYASRMRLILVKPVLLLILLVLTYTGVCPWIGFAHKTAWADEIIIKRDDGTQESFKISHELIEKAMALIVRFSPFALAAWDGKVVGITRPDEMKIMKKDMSVESVRLYGIDAPIDPNPFGKEAAAYTAKMALGKIVKVQPLLLPDPWSRTVAWVWVDGQCLNEELLRNGIVWWFRKYVPWEKGLAKLESDAREAKIGLWKLPSATPPWELQGIPAGQPASPAISEKVEETTRGAVAEPESPITIKKTGESAPAAGAQQTTSASPEKNDGIARRGSVREKLISEEGAPTKLFGDSGSIRQRLLKSRSSDEEQQKLSNSPHTAPQNEGASK